MHRINLDKNWFIFVALLALKLAAAQESKRVLLTSITTSNINTAVGAWVSNSASATATYGDISVWDTSGVTSLTDTFNSATAFNQDVGGWDTSAVTTLLSTFYHASAFNQDIGRWDTSAVRNMQNTFLSATAFNQDISWWDTGAVTTLYQSFESASAFNQRVGGWDTGAVTTFYETFSGASAFNQNIGGWDTGAVRTLFNTFGGASNFNQNISGWSTGAVTSMEFTFNSATAFNQDIGGWDTGAVTTLLSTFQGATAFNQDISGWDTGAVTSLYLTFLGATAFNQDIGGWDTGAVTTLQGTFFGATAFNQDIGGWDTGKVTTFQGTFNGATAFDQDIGGWDTGEVTILQSTFYGATAFNQNIGGWDTGAVASLQSTFSYASAFNQDISGWDTAAVTTFYETFRYATAFSQILCWSTTGMTTTSMFQYSPGSTDPNAAKCACTADQFYDGSNCESCPAGQGSNGKTESCYILPTPVPTPAPTSSPPPSVQPTPVPTITPAPTITLVSSSNSSLPSSTMPEASFIVEPLVAGGISVFCVAIAILTCRTVYKKCKAARNDGGDGNVGSNNNNTTPIISGLNDASIVEIGQDEEFADEEATRPPKQGSFNSSVASELKSMAQKHAEEIERFKISAEAKMKIRERKISRQEQAKVEALAQDREALQNEVAELKEKVRMFQEISKPSTSATNKENDFQLPNHSPHDNNATTAIPTELLKGLLKDSAAPGSQEGGAASDNDPRARVIRASKSVGGAGNVRVAVRVRPPSQRELVGEGNGVCVDVVPADGIVKVGNDKAFTFDVAFSMEATQAQVFDKLGVDLVGWVLGGYNASVFAYGQTSSGKTHSMMGARDSEVLKGLIPRIISLLWECVQAFLNENSKHDCVLKASYLEIYNEEIRDLLGNCEKLKLRNDPKKGIFASGLTMVALQSGEEAMEYIERGARLRSVAATKRLGKLAVACRV